VQDIINDYFNFLNNRGYNQDNIRLFLSRLEEYFDWFNKNNEFFDLLNTQEAPIPLSTEEIKEYIRYLQSGENSLFINANKINSLNEYNNYLIEKKYNNEKTVNKQIIKEILPDFNFDFNTRKTERKKPEFMLESPKTENTPEKEIESFPAPKADQEGSKIKETVFEFEFEMENIRESETSAEDNFIKENTTRVATEERKDLNLHLDNKLKKFTIYLLKEGMDEENVLFSLKNLHEFLNWYRNSKKISFNFFNIEDTFLFIYYLKNKNELPKIINQKLAVLKKYNLYLINEGVQDNLVITDKLLLDDLLDISKYMVWFSNYYKKPFDSLRNSDLETFVGTAGFNKYLVRNILRSLGKYNKFLVAKKLQPDLILTDDKIEDLLENFQNLKTTYSQSRPETIEKEFSVVSQQLESLLNTETEISEDSTDESVPKDVIEEKITPMPDNAPEIEPSQEISPEEAVSLKTEPVDTIPDFVPLESPKSEEIISIAVDTIPPMPEKVESLSPEEAVLQPFNSGIQTKQEEIKTSEPKDENIATEAESIEIYEPILPETVENAVQDSPAAALPGFVEPTPVQRHEIGEFNQSVQQNLPKIIEEISDTTEDNFADDEADTDLGSLEEYDEEDEVDLDLDDSLLDMSESYMDNEIFQLLLDDFIIFLINEEKSENEVDEYLTGTREFLNFQNKKSGEIRINESDVSKYLGYIQSQKQNSQETIKNKLTIIGKFNEFLISENMQAEMVVTGEMLDKVIISDKIYTKAENNLKSSQESNSKITEEEVNKFLGDVREKSSIRNYALVLLIAHTDIKISEALNLKLNDYDQNKAECTIKNSKSPEKNKIIKLKPVVNNALNEYLSERANPKSRYLFTSRENDQLDRTTVHKIFKKLSDKITPIELRQFFYESEL
jgi:integrase/recombinase XerD